MRQTSCEEGRSELTLLTAMTLFVACAALAAVVEDMIELLWRNQGQLTRCVEEAHELIK